MYLNGLKYYLTLFVYFTSNLIAAQSYYNSYNPYSTNIKNLTNNESVIWCTVSKQEQMKCENFSKAIQRDKIKVGNVYYNLECKQAFDKDECMSLLDAEKVHLTNLDSGQVFIGGRYHSLVPIMQEVYEGGFKYFYAVAVVKKGTLRDVSTLHDLRGKKACFSEVGSLAGWIIPIHTKNEVLQLVLRHRHSDHIQLPKITNKLMTEGGLEIIDCNNHVKSAIKFFGPSCAINSLIDKYNPIGDNSDRLCKLCVGRVADGKCTSVDPYAGFQGAFRCLLEAGEIAFLKHTTIEEMTASDDEFTGVSRDTFELLCKDGTRRPITEYRACNWGSVPTHAVVTTSAASAQQRRRYQKFLEKAVQLYSHNTSVLQYNTTNDRNYDNNPVDNWRDQSGNDENRRFRRQSNLDRYFTNRSNTGNYFGERYNQNERDQYGNRDNRDEDSNRENRFDDRNKNKDYDSTEKVTTESTTYYEHFNLFESVPKYGSHHSLLFQDAARNLAPLVETQQTYSGFLENSLRYILDVRRCTVNRMTLCVTSEAEHEKCIKMRTALKAQLLKPEMICYNGHSQVNCMQSIRSGSADVTVLDAGDVYTAGLSYDLVPFISEIYNLGEPEYYVVAVSREEDPSTELTYLKGKYTCHGGMNTAAGWIYPMAYLLSNGWIRPYGCNSIRAAAEYFTKSCIPGAISTEYNTGLPYDNMCDLCHGTSFRYCRRDASEDYYGHTGAFRCLVEGGGDVAFVKHTTVMENTGGKRREFWVRDALPDDFELLCPDGTRAEVFEYKRCNLGKVKANAIVARGGYGYNETEINAFINLFIYAQQFYGRKDPDEFSFSMFYSIPPFTDLIFQDAAQQLQIIDPAMRNYAAYLGPDFMRAQRIVLCDSGASTVTLQFVSLVISCILTLILWKE